VTRALRVATRGSTLARWQAEHIASLLRRADPSVEIELVVVQTTGDIRADVPLHEVGGQGVFVREVQQAVLGGQADLAVHSAKDLPSTPSPTGLVLATVPERGDARDALVGQTLSGIPSGATVATGSVRRRAQLGARRPDLQFIELRGNIGTRLDKVPRGGAIVVAAAALERLGLCERAAEVMNVDVMIPQVGQGALAVECRTDDDETHVLLQKIEHAPSRRAVDLERAFLGALGGGCEFPVGAHFDGSVLRGFLAEGAHVWSAARPISSEGDAAAFAEEAKTAVQRGG
jgi:hydroxymethylbilane synthase